MQNAEDRDTRWKGRPRACPYGNIWWYGSHAGRGVSILCVKTGSLWGCHLHLEGEGLPSSAAGLDATEKSHRKQSTVRQWRVDYISPQPLPHEHTRGLWKRLPLTSLSLYSLSFPSWLALPSPLSPSSGVSLPPSPHPLHTSGLATFSAKGQTVNILVCGPCGLCLNYSVLPM